MLFDKPPTGGTKGTGGAGGKGTDKPGGKK